MGERSRIDFLILVCAILIILIANHLGLVAIPLELNTQLFLVISIGGLAGITLLGWWGRKRRMDEVNAYKFGRVNSAISIGAIVILVVVLLTLVGIHPPGMDPEVPFLFVIPPFALLIVLAVLIEEVVQWLKLDQSN
ncbi:MAG: hypothetical protein JW779_12255 [Candidatus Thorarchaeota archaeon]|nr:hypothetical protein [Candidatus Thorarchaeota archaeon]